MRTSRCYNSLKASNRASRLEAWETGCFVLTLHYTPLFAANPILSLPAVALHVPKTLPRLQRMDLRCHEFLAFSLILIVVPSSNTNTNDNESLWSSLVQEHAVNFQFLHPRQVHSERRKVSESVTWATETCTIFFSPKFSCFF